jgi:TolC family type I secretion outer membrane protein
MLVALAGCASYHDEHVDVSTSKSPDQPWVAPANAVPPARPAERAALPANLAPGATITLPQVIDVALTNNPATREAWLNARAAEAALGSRRSAYLPEVDLNANVTRQKSATQGGRSIFLQTSYGPQLALSYLLFDFGGRAAQVEEARQGLIAADFEHNQAIQDVILRTEQAYYGYLDARALLESQDATIKERQTQLNAAEARHDAGVATIADVLQAKTALSQAQLTRESIEGNLRTIEGALATAMGLPATTHFDFGTLPLDVPAREVGQQVDALIDAAIAARPDLAAARAAAQSAQARVQEVRAQGLPSISLNSTFGRTYFRPNAGVAFTTPYTAAVLFRWPLFTGWRNTYDVRQAELQAQIANENVRAAEQQVDLQVWTSYYSLQTATQRFTTARDLLASAQQSADVAANRYRAGVGSILDLLTAEAALETARAQEVQSRADWFLAIAQLAHDTGTLTQGTTK